MASWEEPGIFSSSLQTQDGIEERSFIIAAQNGNEAAFEALYERYNSRICRYLARMIGDDGVGCEIAQEVFLKVWKSLPGLRAPEHFAGWLYRIATNCAHNYQQQARHYRTISWDAHKDETELLSVEGPEERVGDVELMKLALSRISLAYRSCLILYVIEELPQRDIAQVLKMKETSVSKYVARGKEELRQTYAQLMKGKP